MVLLYMVLLYMVYIVLLQHILYLVVLYILYMVLLYVYTWYFYTFIHGIFKCLATFKHDEVPNLVNENVKITQNGWHYLQSMVCQGFQ